MTITTTTSITNDSFNARIGVEIETTKEMVRWVCPSQWETVKDQSLPDEGREYVSAPLEKSNVAKTIKSLCQRLISNGAETSPKAGIHVHIGLEDFRTNTEWESLSSVLRKVQKALYQIGGSNRAYNRYCEPNTDFELALLWAPMRYKGLNFYSRETLGTIEFRMHEGTLSGERISNWALLCHAVVETAWLGVQLPLEEEEGWQYLLRILPPEIRDWAEEIMEWAEEPIFESSLLESLEEDEIERFIEGAFWMIERK